MKIKQSTGGGTDFEPVSEDLHDAVCVAVVGIGPQTTTWQGNEKTQDKLYITWEIPSERREWENKEGEKFEGAALISKEYTNSADERSRLRKDLKGWRGRDFTTDEFATFEIENLLGKNCRLMVTHSQSKKDPSKTFANVDTITPYKGDAFEAETDLVYYDSEEHTPESFAKVKKWMQKKVILPDGTCPYVEGDASGDVIAATPNAEIADDDEVPF